LDSAAQQLQNESEQYRRDWETLRIKLTQKYNKEFSAD
jgi:hypothetical protein